MLTQRVRISGLLWRETTDDSCFSPTKCRYWKRFDAMLSSWNFCLVFFSSPWYVASNVNTVTTLLFAILNHPLGLTLCGTGKSTRRQKFYRMQYQCYGRREVNIRLISRLLAVCLLLLKSNNFNPRVDKWHASKVCDEITEPFAYLNCWTIEVWYLIFQHTLYADYNYLSMLGFHYTILRLYNGPLEISWYPGNFQNHQHYSRFVAPCLVLWWFCPPRLCY